MRMYPTDVRRRRPWLALPALFSLIFTLGLSPAPTVAATVAAAETSTGTATGAAGAGPATITLGSAAYAPLPVTLADGALAQTVAVGFRHTCALTRSGGVQCWGWNLYGQLGRGTVGGSSAAPQWVSGLRTGVAQISAGEDHTCVTKTDGSVRCWGASTWGMVGNGSTADAVATPVTPTGLGSGVRQVSAGGQLTCALRTWNAVLCWGWNGVGGVGDGTTVDRTTPTRVAALPTGVRSISAGMTYACALTSAKRVWCWGGSQYYGGTGEYFAVTAPKLNTALTDVAALDTRLDRTCAVTTAGATSCWGGPDSLTWRLNAAAATPIAIDGLGSGTSAAVAPGYESVCVRTRAGAVQCIGRSDVAFGDALFGQTRTLSRWAAYTVSGLGQDVVQVANNYHHHCAVKTAGTIMCWGRDAEGQLGNPRRPAIFPDNPVPFAPPSAPSAAAAPTTPSPSPANSWRTQGTYPVNAGTAAPGTESSRTRVASATAATVPERLPPVAEISAGGNNACARTTTGTVWCWGSGLEGALGIPVDDQTGWPGQVTGLSGVTDIDVGDGVVCAVVSGRPWCWGNNWYHQVAPDDTSNYDAPTRISAVAETVRQVAVGSGHVCVLTTAGGVWCWGTNWSGELGTGTLTDSKTPVRPLGLSTGVASISANTLSTCAVLASGEVRCWGWTTSATPADLTPTRVPLPAAATKVVTSGPDCAVLVTGATWCWGENRFGNMGTGALSTDTRPRQVAGLGSGVRDVDHDTATGCVVMTSGQLRCWGVTLGNAHTYDSTVPLAAPGVGAPASQVTMGAGFGCLLTTTAQVWCWGQDAHNTLGRGEDFTRIPFSPTPVRAGTPPM